MGSIALCALVLIALPAYAEWLPASSREVEGIEVERIRFTYSGKKLILNRMLRAATARVAQQDAWIKARQQRIAGSLQKLDADFDRMAVSAGVK